MKNMNEHEITAVSILCKYMKISGKKARDCILLYENEMNKCLEPPIDFIRDILHKYSEQELDRVYNMCVNN